MTDAISAMEYPHWLIVAGAILVVLGVRSRLDPARLPVVEQIVCL